MFNSHSKSEQKWIYFVVILITEIAHASNKTVFIKDYFNIIVFCWTNHYNKYNAYFCWTYALKNLRLFLLKHKGELHLTKVVSLHFTEVVSCTKVSLHFTEVVSLHKGEFTLYWIGECAQRWVYTWLKWWVCTLVSSHFTAPILMMCMLFYPAPSLRWEPSISK